MVHLGGRSSGQKEGGPGGKIRSKNKYVVADSSRVGLGKGSRFTKG